MDPQTAIANLYMGEIAEPVRMFDDLSYIGSNGVGIYVLETSEGLVFIDSSERPNAYEEMVVPSLEKLGLSGRKILAVLLTHGHCDHHYGAKSIQEATGCKVGLTMADTAFMICGIENHDYPVIVPKVDLLLEDGHDYIFGDHTVHVLNGAGHTPGCLNYSFEVHDGADTHRVAVMGGFGIFGPNNDYLRTFMWNNGVYPYGIQAAVDNALIFASTCEKLWLYTVENGCDVFLNPHPHLCGLFANAEKNKARRPGDPNGFVIGVDGVRKWIQERFVECLKMAAIYSTMLEKDEADVISKIKF